MSEDQSRPTENLDTLVRGARELGIELDSAQLQCFAIYLRELLDWNQRMNLTAITAPEEVQVKHFLDSLTLLKALPPAVKSGAKPLRLLDVGAGAGFPGIPIAIVLPAVEVTLLEATQKKCRFLEHVINVLHLANARVVCGRAEELAHRPELREAFDIVVARAVAPLAALVELCLPFVRPGGRMIAFKKLGIESEVAAADRAIRILGGKLAPPVIVRVPILNEERQLIVIEKMKPTPASYPRRPGVPAKSPL